MADSEDGTPAPRQSRGGPVLPPPPPPPPPEPAERSRTKRSAAKKKRAENSQADNPQAEAAGAEKSQQPAGDPAASLRAQSEAARRPGQTADEWSEPGQGQPATEQATRDQSRADQAGAAGGASALTSPKGTQSPKARLGQGDGQTASREPRQRAPRQAGRTRRAQLRLVQVDAWSVMKTSFLLSIALGIVLVVAVAIIWAVLGAAGVWDSINSIVQQAVGGENTEPFDIQEYVGTSRVLGFTMIVAVIDVILITAIATLGAFLYNLSAALLGGIEVTLAEDN
jgi:hypothetical protein